MICIINSDAILVGLRFCEHENDELDGEKVGEVRKFLTQFKKIVATRGLFVIPRPNNTKALVELELTEKNREDEITTLSVADRCRGSEPNLRGSDI